ncbi:MAG: aminoglycoside phosphotransferase family protein [Gammaproteobacteria bacterium]|nr:aminoglycoside phosphotransferase family protein [Gammaproteobacteria bacterium]
MTNSPVSMEDSSSSYLVSANAIAEKYGDKIVGVSDCGYASTVYLGNKNVYKILSNLDIKRKGAHEKESKILHTLEQRLSQTVIHQVPNLVLSEFIDQTTYVCVQSKLPGEVPVKITYKLAVNIGEFLSALHEIQGFEYVAEFEDENETKLSFENYAKERAETFAKKLEAIVSSEDAKLVQECAQEISLKISELSPSNLALLHKDLHEGNLLVNTNGHLSGVIDWDAAQVGPPEWDFAILKQRMPEYWTTIKDAYDGGLNNELIRVCGLLQSLRFWKSFPKQDDFVAKQRSFIQALLNE